jgi:hypothetical protein
MPRQVGKVRVRVKVRVKVESWELRDESPESRGRPQTHQHPRDPHHPRSTG